MNITLSRLSTKDIFQLTACLDKDTAQQAELQWPFHKAAALSFINDYNTWGIWLNGSILAGAIEVKSNGETAYFVGKNYRNNNIASIAVQKIIDIFHDQQLYALISSKNPASLRVAQKSGIRIKFID